MLRSAFLYATVLTVCGLPLTAQSQAQPVRLILDTDIGNDVDDALALAMIHALESRGEVELLAVTITKDNRFAAPFVDLVNTFYGRPDIPIGVVRDGKTKDDAPMLTVPVEEKSSSGRQMYPHRLLDGSQAPDAQQVLKTVLGQQPDDSVTIAQIGFSTNLERLLESAGGKDLITRKVKLLCLMAGNFQKPEPEYNVYTDPESARKLFANWPTPLIFSGFEIGLQVTFPYEAIRKDFNYVAHHPIREAYELYVKKAEDHPNWDSTDVLEATRPDRGYFQLSQPGRVSVTEKNTTTFTPDPKGKARYLIIEPDQVARVRQVITDLVTEPPQQIPASAGSKQQMVF